MEYAGSNLRPAEARCLTPALTPDRIQELVKCGLEPSMVDEKREQALLEAIALLLRARREVEDDNAFNALQGVLKHLEEELFSR